MNVLHDWDNDKLNRGVALQQAIDLGLYVLSNKLHFLKKIKRVQIIEDQLKRNAETLAKLDALVGVTPIFGLNDTLENIPDKRKTLEDLGSQVIDHNHKVVEGEATPYWNPPLHQSKETWFYDKRWSEGNPPKLKDGEYPIFHVDYPYYLAEYIDFLYQIKIKGLEVGGGSLEDYQSIDVCCGYHKTPDSLGFDRNPDSQADVIGDAHHISEYFPENRFKDAKILNSLEHLENPSHVLREINKILQPEGTLTISIPNKMQLWLILRYLYSGRQTVSTEHINSWNTPEIENLLRKTGFKTTNISYTTFKQYADRSPIIKLIHLFLPRISEYSLLIQAVKKAPATLSGYEISGRV